MSENPTIDQIIKYESGELGAVEALELFSGLVKSGMAWTLQGSYGRQAKSFIAQGFLTEEGEVTAWGRDFAEDIDEGITEGEEDEEF